MAAWLEEPALRGRPLVLGGKSRERGVVEVVSAEAAAGGVRTGMSLRQAEQLCPEAQLRPADQGAAARVKSLLLSSLYRFTNEVGPGEEGFAFMAIDRLRLRWPDMTSLARSVARSVADRLSVEPSIGIGDNLFVSQVAASAAVPTKPVVVTPQTTRQYLAPLSLEVLGLEQDLQETLELLGLKRLGALQRLSRVAFRRQFGIKNVAVHDLACGIDPRPLEPWQPPVRLEERAAFEQPLDSTEALQFVVSGLADQVGDRLLELGLGARSVLVTLEQESNRKLPVAISFAYPLTKGRDLFERIRPRLMKAQLTSRVERISLRVQQLEPAHVRQPGLLLRGDGLKESLADAVSRLQEEYRAALVCKACLVEGAAQIPERRVQWRPA
jgi:nucleotidyltransferase/DNA polymerase involved in DNA repair